MRLHLKLILILSRSNLSEGFFVVLFVPRALPHHIKWRHLCTSIKTSLKKYFLVAFDPLQINIYRYKPSSSLCVCWKTSNVTSTWITWWECFPGWHQWKRKDQRGWPRPWPLSCGRSSRNSTSSSWSGLSWGCFFCCWNCCPGRGKQIQIKNYFIHFY